VQFRQPMTGAAGYGQVVCYANGQFQSNLMTPQGEIAIAGGWQMAGNQVGLQGMFAFALNPFNRLPYSLILTINNYNQGAINFTALTGEKVVWQRIS
jgi:hypothetical protein